MVRFIVALIVSFIAGAVLFDLAAMADGMSDSMNAMFTLFPYGTFVSVRTSWENTGGLVLTLIQFPVYVLVVMVLKGKRARIAAVLAIVAFHIITARVELRSYERSSGSLITSSAPRRGVMFIARDQYRIPHSFRSAMSLVDQARHINRSHSMVSSRWDIALLKECEALYWDTSYKHYTPSGVEILLIS